LATVRCNLYNGFNTFELTEEYSMRAIDPTDCTPQSDVFTTRLVVRSYELDAYGHVNNAVYLNYLEAARCDCLNQRGLSFNDFKRWGKSPVVSQAHLRYLAPAYADDVLTITTTIVALGRASVTMSFELVNQAGTLVLTATMDFVFLNADGKPTRAPAAFMEAFSSSAKVDSVGVEAP